MIFKWNSNKMIIIQLKSQKRHNKKRIHLKIVNAESFKSIQMIELLGR